MLRKLKQFIHDNKDTLLNLLVMCIQAVSKMSDKEFIEKDK